MRLNPHDLDAHLKRPLAPIYFVFGDEPLLVDEATGKLRSTAQAQGFTERVRLTAESGFDWNTLLGEANALSLFASRKLIELSMPGGKPGDAGAKALMDYAQTPPPDNLLILQSGRLDGATRKRKWFSALEKAGVVVQVQAPDAASLPNWIMQRMRQQGLQADNEVARFLAQLNEGNLLACDQEIRKLALLSEDGRVTIDDARKSAADNARYNMFMFVDVCLGGNLKRAMRMLRGMREEGAEPVLIAWAMTKEIRGMVGISSELAKGLPLGQAMKKACVWSSRSTVVKRAAERLSLRQWQERLLDMAHLDRLIKGAETGNIWTEMETTVAAICGSRSSMVTTR